MMNVNPDLETTEAERLRALHRYGILNTTPEAALDELTALTQAVFNVPLVYISLIDEYRKFIKSSVGMSPREMPQQGSFCSHTLLQACPLVVLDTSRDARFKDHPFVTGPPNILFYAGAPVVDKNGMRMGALCIADQTARTSFTSAEKGVLMRLASMAAKAIENQLYLTGSDDSEGSVEDVSGPLLCSAIDQGRWSWEADSEKAFFSAQAHVLLGYEATPGFRPLNWLLTCVHPGDVAKVYADTEKFLESSEPSLEVEYRIQHCKGAWKWIRTRAVAFRNEQGKMLRLNGVISDVTQPRTIDELTGLYTRFAFLDYVEWRLQRIPDMGEQFAVLVIDLDDFKRLNAGVGHDAADAVLIEVARRIQETLGLSVGWAAGRVVGDEFAILLENVNALDAGSYASSLRFLLQQPIHIQGQSVSLKASVGLALGQRHYTRAKDLVADASAAMQASRSHNERDPLFYSDAVHKSLRRRLHLEAALRTAIEKDELTLNYQPKVRLTDSALLGFEALVRWSSNDGLPITPTEFIPIAEETGLILPLGRWALRKAVEQIKQWREARLLVEGMSVAVNLSAKQVSDYGLSEYIEGLLRNHKVPGRYLRIEITEGSLIAEVDKALALARRFKELGIALDLDDFGTGYSSLSYLKQFPFDSVKIDRSFVSQLSTKMPEPITESVIALGKALSFEVVAEGIETEEQLEILRELGCHVGQGFLFSRAMTHAEATSLMLTGASSFACRQTRVAGDSEPSPLLCTNLAPLAKNLVCREGGASMDKSSAVCS